MVSEQDYRRIAAEASLDVRTVRRVFGGAAVRSAATMKSIEDACMALGIKFRAPKPGTVVVSPKESVSRKVRK